MENGREFDEALAEMQAAGIAEADPSLDVDGWDAAAKAAALANVLLNARMTPQQVERTGIGHLTGAACGGRGARQQAEAGGARERRGAEVVVAGSGSRSCLPATCSRRSAASRTRCSSRPTCSARSRFAQLGGGLTQTAYALVTDLAACCQAPCS